MSYVELHARSAFSFLEGASLPELLIEMCAAHAIPAMALLDKDGVYGSPRFHAHATRAGIQAHVGAEVTVRDAHGSTRYPLLVESRHGYQQLCRLLTRTKLRNKKGEGFAHPNEMAEFAAGGGLVCLSGDEHGPLATALERGGADAGRRCLEQLIADFGAGNVFVELQRHFDRRQEARNQMAVELARSFRLPLLATNGVSYARREEREILDAFTCIRHHVKLETAGQLLARNSERHVRSPKEMARLFADLPEAIANTRELSARLQFTLKDLGYEFPRYPVPVGETQMSFLRARTWEGAHDRYRPISDRVRRQLERELRLIEKLDLAGYFLIVWDIIRFCREHNILVQGRGSAANSAVCYSLGITAVDPIGMELLFERFLSEERGEWPDIDLDLPSGDDRERAIQYVYQRYGELGAAMTANVITYRGRSAAREMGKVLGFDTESLNRLSSLVGSWEWRDPRDTLDLQFRQAGFDARHPRIARFIDLCGAIQDLPRHLGQHSGGMVICQGQLDSVVPLEPASMPGRVVVQWDKDDCADLGIIKVDLLGLGMMAVLKDSVALVREHYHEEVDLAHLPPNDPAVYHDLQTADTVGLFQVESRAQMASLPRNHPTCFYDIVVQVALIRPGPIVGQMTNPYLKRRQGKERVTYPHPSLEPVLRRTLGVPLFQEQLLRMAMICANFTGGEAEELRRALGSKRSEQRMRAIEEKLRAGMSRNGITAAQQDEIVKFITSFALYGFPESHSASFALLAYASAYLRCHYLAAFTAALINNYPMGFYHPATIIKDSQRRGLKFRPVDVTKSEWNCTIEEEVCDSGGAQLTEAFGGARLQPRHPSLENDGALAPEDKKHLVVRLGFNRVRGMQKATADALVAARTQRPFTSVSDLVQRVPQLSKSDLQTLARIGALNFINDEVRLHRRDALWQAARAAQSAGPLFAAVPESDATSPLAAMSPTERVQADFHGTGVTIGPHPMAYKRAELAAQLPGVRILRAAELKTLPDGAPVRYAGCVIVRQRPGTAKGLIFLSVEDETGIANVVIMPDLYEQNRLLVIGEQFLYVEGVLQNKEKVVHIMAQKLAPLAGLELRQVAHEYDHKASVYSRYWGD